MNNKDIKLLEANDWFVECESPFEIRHMDGGAFASGTAAQIVLDDIKQENKKHKLFTIKEAYFHNIIDNEQFIQQIISTLENFHS